MVLRTEPLEPLGIRIQDPAIALLLTHYMTWTIVTNLPRSILFI